MESFNEAFDYYSGITKYDNRKAYDIVKSDASAKSKVLYGIMTYTGDGCEKDVLEGTSAVEDSLDELMSIVDSDPEAAYLAGRLYLEGIGVRTDRNKGLELLNKASDSGVPIAQVYVGRLHKFGNYAEKSIDRAMVLFQKSAKAECAAAYRELGHLYYYAQGVRKDVKKAEEYYRKAAEKNEPWAMDGLGRIDAFAKPPKEDEARKMLLGAFEQGIRNNDVSVITADESWVPDRKDKVRLVLIGDGVKNIEDNAFEEIQSISRIFFPDSLERIGNEAFSEIGDDEAVPIRIPPNVQTIGASAFSYANIASLDLGNVKEIGDKAFNEASIKKDFKIPGSVRSIGKRAFYSQKVSVTVYVPETITIPNGTFSSSTKVERVPIGQIDVKEEDKSKHEGMTEKESPNCKESPVKENIDDENADNKVTTESPLPVPVLDEKLLRLSEEGDPEAQFGLGALHCREALRLFILSAKSDNPKAKMIVDSLNWLVNEKLMDGPTSVIMDDDTPIVVKKEPSPEEESGSNGKEGKRRFLFGRKK